MSRVNNCNKHQTYWKSSEAFNLRYRQKRIPSVALFNILLEDLANITEQKKKKPGGIRIRRDEADCVHKLSE